MSRIRVWGRDLSMGARFALAGGREGWTRILLTGVGVGLGVALLLITAALPSALAAREERGSARSTASSHLAREPAADTLLVSPSSQTFRDLSVFGALLKAEGPDAPVPPGLKKIPGDGELAVSPALDALLKSEDGAALRARLSGPVTAIIGDAGLAGPGELYFYQGRGDLHGADGSPASRVKRVTDFADDFGEEPLTPVLMLLVVLTFVALLTPVAVFVAAAVRFGSDSRDRRLAALRLVGADGRAVRRIAAGEALAGSLAGLVLGTGFFLIGSRFVSDISVSQRSIFPADLNPSPVLATLVVLAVPAVAVAVTLFTLRGVVIEPLGVVRTITPGRRRVAWRLLMPLAGLAALVPLTGRGDSGGRFNQWQVSGGVVLLLVGITALLPWVLERVVGRLRGGRVSVQLAVRRLQVSSGTAARLVNGIAVAVAGAIALQMLFAGVEDKYLQETGEDPSRASLSIQLRAGTGDPTAEDVAREMAGARGVTRAVGLTGVRAAPSVPAPTNTGVELTIGTCESLREIAFFDSCEDGDVFVLPGANPETAAPGRKVFVGAVQHPSDASGVGSWTVPARLKSAAGRRDPVGVVHGGLLVTPAAAPKPTGATEWSQVHAQVDPNVPDALEWARAAAFRADPTGTALTLQYVRQSKRFTAIRTALFIGAAVVLVLIGASLLVSQLEQLRERKKLLSALVAFGTKRSTLSMSVLWQTALPIGLGLGLATAVGVGLGSVLMRMTDVAVHIDWYAVAALVAAGAGVVALVTLLSLPPLLRLMRPDGLRTE
ncbi:FtsX-like permease family protein [Streptomyces sp. NPDC006430]|uniref:FtsX-like permease family protein n=1 Tax=Streptomyces sp. NPDC006430 TaxID=3154299 RepID=UPI0033A58F9F